MKILITIVLFLIPALGANASNGTVMERVLADHISEHLTQMYPLDSFRFTVELRRVANQLQSLDPKEIKEVRYNGMGQPAGYTHFEVIIPSLTRRPQTHVQAFIEVQRFLPVPLERIESGQMLTVDLFRMEWVDITRQTGLFITDTSEFSNQVAGRILRIGQPVRASELKALPVVQAGDQVLMNYDSGLFGIRLLCLARQSGAPGEIIRVQNEETRKIYLASINPDGTVTWKQTL